MIGIVGNIRNLFFPGLRKENVVVNMNVNGGRIWELFS